MKSIQGIILVLVLAAAMTSCKNDKTSGSEANEVEQSSVNLNDSKALAGTGVEDVSEMLVLDQNQVIQPGNVGFNFKTYNASRVYLPNIESDKIDFDKNQIFAIFADVTVKKTFFKVERFDASGEQPELNVTTIVTQNDVSKYRPYYIVTVPKSVEGFPIIRIDGSQIPVFIIE